MCRYINSLRRGFQHNFQKVSAVQTQNGPSVGVNISNQFQSGRQHVRRFQPGKQKQAVYFSHLILLFVDRTDFSGQYKSRIYGVRRIFILYPVFLFQPVKPFFCWFQLLFQFFSPDGMGKISGSDNVNPLFSGPKVQMLQVAFLAGGSGKPGMYM